MGKRNIYILEIKNKIDTTVTDIDNTINNITDASKEEKVAFLFILSSFHKKRIVTYSYYLV